MRSGAGVSIHAPTGGATAAVGKVFNGTGCFNPRAHGGRDLFKGTCHCGCGVSIHAPTGGATLPGSQRRIVTGVSIHAPTGGATAAGNPRYQKFIYVSIHAPTGGATHLFGYTFADLLVSIHAPTGGATMPFIGIPLLIIAFQSTRPRGARLCPGSIPNKEV